METGVIKLLALFSPSLGLLLSLFFPIWSGIRFDSIKTGMNKNQVRSILGKETDANVDDLRKFDNVHDFVCWEVFGGVIVVAFDKNGCVAEKAFLPLVSSPKTGTDQAAVIPPGD